MSRIIVIFRSFACAIMEEINHPNLIPYQLILDELEGRLSAEGIQELEYWKSASAEHLKEYHHIIHLTDDLEVPGVGKPRLITETMGKTRPVPDNKWLLVSVVFIILLILWYLGLQ